LEGRVSVHRGAYRLEATTSLILQHDLKAASKHLDWDLDFDDARYSAVVSRPRAIGFRIEYSFNGNQ